MLQRKEWAYGKMVAGRDYLSLDQSFEDFARELADAVTRSGIVKTHFCIDPDNGQYSDPMLRKLACKRPSWRIQIDPEILDKFYNGKMGIRAQYYKSPFVGRASNAFLIGSILDPLLEFSRSNNPADEVFLRKSLEGKSAKMWISEKDLKGRKIVRAGDLDLDEQSIINDWLELARSVKRGEYDSEYQLYSAAINGVRAPIADQLEIKGAWLSSDGNEVVAQDKQDRDLQLFMFGFT